MEAFGDYGKYYNLLYQDKDYASEVAYIEMLIEKNSPGAKTVLDLGCGTGRHDILLAEKGFSLTGVDLSEEMLSAAIDQKRIRGFDSSQIEFLSGDVRSIRLGKRFDVVISLFDVMSYQTTNADLKNAFETVSIHLKKNGIFIFDCWYGPGVLSDPPTTRVKELENERIILTRIAEPILHPDENLVDVCYHLFVRDKKTQNVEEIRENHIMRYLFKPEIEMIFDSFGFEMISFSAFMRDSLPAPGNWDVCFIGRKKRSPSKIAFVR
ncbi:MAG: SAM-dependent methyltransferase [Desulfobacterium sp.]|nr:SAM-dependent methyltransferase [Desulfobacterium sp.]